MDIREIRKQLSEQYDDNFTIELFTNFVLEIHECFGNFLSIEEIIKRLKENVKTNIVIKKQLEPETMDARYDLYERCVYLREEESKDIEMSKYLLFHELLHAITSKDLPDSRRIMGFSFFTNQLGMGLNEAMTEYLVQQRNKRYGVEYVSGYRTVVEQMSHLAEIVGQEKLIKCFFMNPEKLAELLEEHNMNYDEIENAFYHLVGKDEDVFNIMNGNELRDKRNFNLEVHAKMIFDNFCRAIGDVTTIEEFNKKYEKLNKYQIQDVNINKIMQYEYYMEINRDIDKLKNKVPIEELKTTLENLNIDWEKCKLIWNVSKLFDSDSNKMAINLSKYYRENPNQYIEFASENYINLYRRFSQTNLIPEGEYLYDIYKYPMIGRFLKEHKEYEYDEVHTVKVQVRPTMTIYMFETNDGKRWIYSFEDSVRTVKKGDSDFVLYYTEEGNERIEIHWDEQGNNWEYFGPNYKDFRIAMIYEENSQLEDVEWSLANKIGDPKEIEQKIGNIKQRISNKRNGILH